jgi:hypothetical protein
MSVSTAVSAAATTAVSPSLKVIEEWNAKVEERLAAARRAINDELTPLNHLCFVFGLGAGARYIRNHVKWKLKEAGYRVAANHEWEVYGEILHVFGDEWDPRNPACPPCPKSLDAVLHATDIMPES